MSYEPPVLQSWEWSAAYRAHPRTQGPKGRYGLTSAQHGTRFLDTAIAKLVLRESGLELDNNTRWCLTGAERARTDTQTTSRHSRHSTHATAVRVLTTTCNHKITTSTGAALKSEDARYLRQAVMCIGWCEPNAAQPRTCGMTGFGCFHVALDGLIEVDGSALPVLICPPELEQCCARASGGDTTRLNELWSHLPRAQPCWHFENT